MMFNANAMVQSSFLFAGFIENDEAFKATEMGQIEAAQYVTNWAMAIANALQYLDQSAPCDFPGVFEYEVTEYFGKALCEAYGQSNTYLATALVDSMREFFAQGDDALNECQLMQLGAVILETVE